MEVKESNCTYICDEQTGYAIGAYSNEHQEQFSLTFYRDHYPDCADSDDMFVAASHSIRGDGQIFEARLVKITGPYAFQETIFESSPLGERTTFKEMAGRPNGAYKPTGIKEAVED